MSDEDGFAKTAASLRVFGEALEPNEVTRLLGHEPTEAWEKGAPGYQGRPRSQGMWILESRARSDTGLEEQLRDLLSSISESIQVWESLVARFDCDIFVGAWMESDNAVFSLGPEILLEMGKRGLVLSADLYFVGEDED